MGSLARKLQRAAVPTGARLFHYTIGECLNGILRDSVITVASAGVPDGEVPAVWFSFHPDWEPTANKAMLERATGRLLLGTRETTASVGGGLARIEVSPTRAPHDWASYLRLAGVRSERAGGLRRAALDAGSHPRLWRVTFDPVGRADWLAVEVHHEGSWRPHDQPSRAGSETHDALQELRR